MSTPSDDDMDDEDREGWTAFAKGRPPLRDIRAITPSPSRTRERPRSYIDAGFRV
jgi:hypothetical protein